MKYIFILIFSFVLLQSSYSQSINNMTLLGHKNEFTSGGTPAGWYYSSCWGWTAPNGKEYAIVGFYGGTVWYDISDPANIVRCDTIYGPASFYNYREMATYSHYCYIVSEGGLGVQIVDMQYLPDSVHLVKNYTFPGYTRSHTIRNDGRFLYCNGGAYNNGGVFILDLLDPENPVKRGQWGTRYVHDCHVRNDTIYAANVYEGILSVLDATNKDSIKFITSWTYPGAVTHNAWTSKNGDYLITTDEGGSNHAKVWDIDNIMSPIQVADITPYEPTMVHNAYVKGDTLYLSHYRAGVIVYDISTPESPSEIGHYDTYPGSGTAYQGSWNVYPYFASGKIITADISSGLYVLQMGTSVGISNNNGMLPAEYKLAQNYPNPFNPETKISYSLPVNSDVKLVVYNALGKELANYTYANQQAGTHEITWNAKNLSSGIYFYKITAGNFSDTKKMMLVR